jgi:hypothetical protein
MAKDRLSPAQERVMKWLRNGWSALQLNGCVIEINGKRVCNLDTMTVLERKGLVERDGAYYWRATEKGKVGDGN